MFFCIINGIIKFKVDFNYFKWLIDVYFLWEVVDMKIWINCFIEIKVYEN